MIHAALVLSTEALTLVYPEPVRRRLGALTGTVAPVIPAERWRGCGGELAAAEVIFTGWGAPVMDEEFLRAAPRLKVVFYAGGSVRYFATEALWRRGVRMTTAQAINAVPVAEYVLSAIQLGLKRFWHYARLTREIKTFPTERPLPGAYGTVVGLVSYGVIARMVREKLRALETQVIVYDPFLSEAEAAREGVKRVTLDELFATADAVSLHVPSLPETRGLITGRHLAQMKPGAFFLNTARGDVVNEPEMVEVLACRPDLQAVLDVTAPEPPPPESPLYTLPNVVLTPHIAGSVGAECQRMGLGMVEEFERYCAGQPLRWEITAERAALIA